MTPLDLTTKKFLESLDWQTRKDPVYMCSSVIARRLFSRGNSIKIIDTWWQVFFTSNRWKGQWFEPQFLRGKVMYSPSFTLVFNYVWNGIPAWYKCQEKMRCKFRFAFYSGFLFILIKVTYYIRFTLFLLLLYLSICKLCNIKVSALPLSLFRFLDENAYTCTPCNVCVYTCSCTSLATRVVKRYA